MILAMERYQKVFADHGAVVDCPPLVQSLSEDELIRILGDYDGWIIGDDPVTHAVLSAGKDGRLKAAVRWGAGTDNVDFEAAKALGYHIVNTPGTFAEEVSDVAVGYLIGINRSLFQIDRGIRSGKWPKPTGRSLSEKIVALVGYGNIGKSLARKLQAIGLRTNVYDPFAKVEPSDNLTVLTWPDKIEEADFVVLTCSLTTDNLHLLNSITFERLKHGVMIVNVGRGPLIDETALAAALKSGKIAAAALDVFENEPLPQNTELREIENCIFGSHNSSNTIEAVDRTSHLALNILFTQLNLKA